jgi:hypothetical protein
MMQEDIILQAVESIVVVRASQEDIPKVLAFAKKMVLLVVFKNVFKISVVMSVWS